MLMSAADAGFADPATVTLTLLTTLFGAVRSVFERNLPAEAADAVGGQLRLMCLSYIDAVRTPGAATAPKKVLSE